MPPSYVAAVGPKQVGRAPWSVGDRLLSMYFDQVAPHDTVVNFKPVHFWNRPGVSRNMTDLSPEHVNIIARTAWLQRCGRESNPPSVFGVMWLVSHHESRQDTVQDASGGITPGTSPNRPFWTERCGLCVA